MAAGICHEPEWALGRAYRDIYGYVKVRNVIATSDCAELQLVRRGPHCSNYPQRNRKERLSWQDTKVVFDTSNELFPIAETMCGGSF